MDKPAAQEVIRQNSTEIGQSANGSWYVKSVKVYDDNPDSAAKTLEVMKANAEQLTR